MLKRRIAAAVIVKDEIAVQSIGFQRYLPVGRPEIAVEFLSHWGADEIVLLDEWHAGTYGIPDEKTVDAIRLCARLEGMLTDPVYEGKSMAATIDLVREVTPAEIAAAEDAANAVILEHRPVTIRFVSAEEAAALLRLCR